MSIAAESRIANFVVSYGTSLEAEL